jgi:upstream activation factor subunit UAF30
MAAKKKGGKKAAKKGGKKAAKKSPKKAKKSGRKPNAAFMKPVQPNEKLAAIVGPGAMPRTELTKKLWVYIKKNNLQDKKNRRMINADDKMKALFGGKSSASMFELTKYASKNLSK